MAHQGMHVPTSTPHIASYQYESLLNGRSHSMPNTLAHIGVQTLITRGVVRKADLRWALVGVIVPDIPWILGRVTEPLAPGLHTHDLWAYYIAQSSLAVSLLLCGALASLAAKPTRAFVILSLNALLHLLLDGLQAKGGNGVHLIAPLSWQDWNAGWFGLESWPTNILTALGICVGILVVVHWFRSPVGLVCSRPRLLLSAVLLTLYLALPVPLRHGPLVADTNSVGTLKDRHERAGREAQFDRAQYVVRGSAHSLRTYVGEELRLRRPWLEQSAIVSARGTFSDDSTIALSGLHRHPGRRRDVWSYIGLSIIAAAWLVPALGKPGLRATKPAAGLNDRL
jgi:hypothetical protein